jgi:hypothetical protein
VFELFLPYPHDGLLLLVTFRYLLSEYGLENISFRARSPEFVGIVLGP